MRIWRSIVLLLILLLTACGNDESAPVPSSAANGKSIVVYKSPT